MSAVVRPAFYRHMAVALSAFVIIGFSQTYYLRFLTDLPPLDTLVHLHSVVFTAWLLVFIAQTRLVAAQRVDLHMKLGIAALALAVVVVATSFATTAVKATIPRIHPSGLTPPQFTIVGIMSLVLFAGFLALGVAFRRRAAYHKRFMILAMIGVLTPAASRIVTQLGTARPLDVPRAHRSGAVRGVLPRIRLAQATYRAPGVRHRGRGTHCLVAAARDDRAQRVVSADR